MTAAPPSPVRYDIDGRILTIRLAGRHRNPLSRRTVADLRAALELLADDDVHACVILATGRHFCTGGDHQEVAQLNDAARARLLAEIRSLFAQLAASPVPVVVGVDGAAIGGGFQLALLADIIITTARATFSLPQLRLGISVEASAVRALSERVGVSLTRRIILLGETVTGERAVETGIADYLCEPAELDDRVATLAKEFAAAPPLTLRKLRARIDDANGQIAAAARREADSATTRVPPMPDDPTQGSGRCPTS